MIPAWSRTDDVWEPCWLISAMPHGAGQRHVLIAFDDRPHANWNYPAGSLRIQSIEVDKIRIRRNVIPLMEKPEPEPYDRDGYGSGSEGC